MMSPVNKSWLLTVERYLNPCNNSKRLDIEKTTSPTPTANNTVIFSWSHRLQLPERVYKLKLESDLTPIPGILKPQHHAADVEPDQL
ncbi:hypothetical protein PAMA_003916 [Pampus argenteus]